MSIQQLLTIEMQWKELADLLELMYALAQVHDVDFYEVEKVRQDKAEKRGGFHDRIFLIDVE